MRFQSDAASTTWLTNCAPKNYDDYCQALRSAEENAFYTQESVKRINKGLVRRDSVRPEPNVTSYNRNRLALESDVASLIQQRR